MGVLLCARCHLIVVRHRQIDDDRIIGHENRQVRRAECWQLGGSAPAPRPNAADDARTSRTVELRHIVPLIDRGSKELVPTCVCWWSRVSWAAPPARAVDPKDALRLPAQACWLRRRDIQTLRMIADLESSGMETTLDDVRKSMTTQDFEHSDTNGDGSIDQDEFRRMQSRARMAKAHEHANQAETHAAVNMFDEAHTKQLKR